MLCPHAVAQILHIKDTSDVDSRIEFTLKIVQGVIMPRVSYHLYGPKQTKITLEPSFKAVIDMKCLTDDIAQIKLGLPGQVTELAEAKEWKEDEQHELTLHTDKALLGLKVGDYLAAFSSDLKITIADD